MNIIRLLMKYILLINRFEDINLNTIHSKFGETKTILTGTNVIVTFFVDGISPKEFVSY